MHRLSASSLTVLIACAAGASSPAFADNLLGAYIGAGVGQSNVGSNDAYDFGYFGGYHDRDAAWKVIAGIRPLPIVGAELEYIDFGSGNGNNGFYANGEFYGNSSSHPKATVLYGLGYLPLPLPFLDIYGKVGAARLQSDINSYVFPTGCVPPFPVSGCTAVAFRTDQQDTRFAYGGGVQGKWQDFAFRAEYERISSQFGDPAAYTISVTWTF
ncbi:MAG TPA: outer membrane beta-barrel protein [Steroidobacteraceae bacterium]|nr:outer membrane beta-barrel protein [Steroidobacteraceae bacterium]